jgi:hypothetical protein
MLHHQYPGMRQRAERGVRAKKVTNGASTQDDVRRYWAREPLYDVLRVLYRKC